MFAAAENQISPNDKTYKKAENEQSADANTKNSDTIDTCAQGVKAKRPPMGKKLHLRVSIFQK